MKNKITTIKEISQDTDHLKGVYENITLWGRWPDGDVSFERMMEWLYDNKHDVEHMIKVGEKIKSLEG